MPSDIQLMIIAAISVSCFHTLAGPDHYLPFIALSKSRGWSFRKTIFWTIVCGCGHVWSSVLLALGAAAIGWSISTLHAFQGLRGGVAGWALLFFGVLYTLWGFWKLRKGKPHKHFELGDDDSLYVFEHNHNTPVTRKERHVVTPWVMFLIFLLGPCEPMIALIYLPAAQHSYSAMFLLIGIYTVFTLFTMVTIVLMGYYGLSFIKTEKLEKYMHPISGLTIFICGLGMVFLNW